LDFGISAQPTQALHAKGCEAAEGFLSTWDEAADIERFR
jgi:hypothetical protein